MSEGDKYDESYFMRGKETGKSLYTSYRWMPDLTIPMCRAIADHCGIVAGASVLDFGCARGYTVKALRMLGYEAWGYDISRWALENCDHEVREYVSTNFNYDYDWIIAKDVLEHVNRPDEAVIDIMEAANKGVFAVVPLSAKNGAQYVVKEYELDVTHLHRLTLATWAGLFIRPGWRVECSYRVKGVKDNYYKPGWESGNGFLTIRRMED